MESPGGVLVRLQSVSMRQVRVPSLSTYCSFRSSISEAFSVVVDQIVQLVMHT